MDPKEMLKEQLYKRVDQGLSLADGKYKSLVTESCLAYQTSRRESMPDMRKAILASSLDQYRRRLIESGIPAKYIDEAVENVSDVTNPISLMFSMISLLVPNFAYMDACAVQPMPTETSPIFFQNLIANTTRNGVTQGDSLLGGTAWNSNNQYSSNRNKEAIVGSATPWTLTTAIHPLLKGTVKVWSADKSILLKDDGAGGFTRIKGTITLGAASVNYTTGVISIATSAGALTGGTVDYRYDMDAAGLDPAQVLYEWSTKSLTANPRRLRSLYALENFYAAKQVLQGIDVDKLLSDSMLGYMNKEVSCGVFDDMQDECLSAATWTSTLPSGVSWAFHRLSMLRTFTGAANGLRKGFNRGSGNILVLGNNWMSEIETFGDDVWAPTKFSKEPIGPYVAGKLNDRFTVIKDMARGDSSGFMAYKGDDTEASYVVGVFIALYNTDPLAMDDLKVRRGMGTSIGQSLLFDNSIVELDITA